MANIYPEINLPKLVAPRSQTSADQSEKVAPFFDFRFGEFVFNPDGRPKIATPKETFEQWCIKVACTERFSRLAYTDRYGVELAYIPTMNDVYAARSQIIRTLTEAIMANPQTQWVKNFSFKVKGDNVWVSFDVKGKFFDEASRIEVII